MITREEFAALLARVEALESHEHSYAGPRDSLGTVWHRTGPDMVTDHGHDAYLAAMSTKGQR